MYVKFIILLIALVNVLNHVLQDVLVVFVGKYVVIYSAEGKLLDFVSDLLYHFKQNLLVDVLAETVVKLLPQQPF